LTVQKVASAVRAPQARPLPPSRLQLHLAIAERRIPQVVRQHAAHGHGADAQPQPQGRLRLRRFLNVPLDQHLTGVRREDGQRPIKQAHQFVSL